MENYRQSGGVVITWNGRSLRNELLCVDTRRQKTQSGMSGKALLIVGARGSGKTTTAKQLISKVHKDARLVYDVNAEYKDLYDKPFLEFDEFTNKLNSIRNGVVLIEEATIFLSNHGNNFDVRSALVRARHNNNTFIFVFHSLRAIPKYIFDLCDFIYLHKTNDAPQILDKFENPRLNEYFERVRASDWLQNSDGKKYSPRLLFAIQD